MRIWVDADACPVGAKELLYRTADRERLEVVFVANRFMRLPNSRFLRLQQVESGFDVADGEIVRQLLAGDIVITSDIPLASEALAKNGVVLTPRGEALTTETIGERLAMRDFLDSLRGSGIETDGPPPYSERNRQQFANLLHRTLVRLRA